MLRFHSALMLNLVETSILWYDFCVNMTNYEIAKLLRNIAAAYSIKNDQKYRFQIIAYQKAADAVGGTNSELKELFKENKLDMLPGIGSSIKTHLEELFKTGKVKHFEWVTKGIPKTVFLLLDVPTFGPKKAYKLVKEFSLTNENTVIDDIERIAKEGKIASTSMSARAAFPDQHIHRVQPMPYRDRDREREGEKNDGKGNGPPSPGPIGGEKKRLCL